jgi:hypothetical protein
MVKRKLWLLALAAGLGFVWPMLAGNPQRIDHATFLPRRSNPDDSGLYNAFIDPANGYAYFLGNYLTKVDITVDPPKPVGAPLNTGSSSFVAIDPTAGYGYITRPPALNRYLLGAGTNDITTAGSLTPAVGAPGAIFVDDSNADPAQHYGYLVCLVANTPTRISKLALATFNEVSFTSLNAGETKSGSGLVDTTNGYIYFATGTTNSTNAEIVKLKMTPGTNAPVRVAALAIDTQGQGFGFGSLDPIHGYAYYGTYGSANLASKIYKVKLGAGDTAPTLVGTIDLPEGQARLSLSVIDPVNGFVYFANDNTYPGGVHQFSLNGTNLPVEISYLPFQGGLSNNPPQGVSTFNVTTNGDGVLPYGEIYFRSAVFDPVRGYAYFGQDSKPNQIVKFKVARVDPFTLNGVQTQTNGSVQFSFANINGGSFSALTATNLALPLTNWTSLGSVTEVSPGQFQFSDPQPARDPQRFYRVSSP